MDNLQVCNYPFRILEIVHCVQSKNLDIFVIMTSMKIKMKVVSSIKTLKTRHPDCKVVRRKGRLYVINKTNPRFKARQG